MQLIWNIVCENTEITEAGQPERIPEVLQLVEALLQRLALQRQSSHRTACEHWWGWATAPQRLGADCFGPGGRLAGSGATFDESSLHQTKK